MSNAPALPKLEDLYRPSLEALIKLGGSGSNDEIQDAISAALNLTPEQLDAVYPKSGASILPDRMSWARSYLKFAGFVTSPKRGVWVLTEAGQSAAAKSHAEIKVLVAEAYRQMVAAKKQSEYESGPPSDAAQGEAYQDWSERLLQRVLAIDPSAFERLCQRLLRESGFTKVEVTGKSSDGGIDGVGVLRMNLISFQVLFQCKRWKGSVGSEVVRNFRGAMQGRADKGLIITTGTFTAEARKEATRDGAPAIDLIDGETLCDLLKERSLGVIVREVRVEEVMIDEEFFAAV
jgi:restriction system protein